MGDRHSLHSDGRTLAVSLRDGGSVFGAGGWLVHEPASGPTVGDARGADGGVASARSHPSLRYFDRGCQFISEEYRRFLEAYQLTCSMSAVGSCADHAAAESFFGVLKRERVNRRHYRTRVEARADIIDCIERYHNPRQRRRLEWQQQGLARQAHAVGGPAKNILRSRPPSGNGRLVAEYLSGQLHAGLLLGAV